jgi:hypothetical protein
MEHEHSITVQENETLPLLIILFIHMESIRQQRGKNILCVNICLSGQNELFRFYSIIKPKKICKI